MFNEQWVRCLEQYTLFVIHYALILTFQRGQFLFGFGYNGFVG
jgi:hypothetical protein